MATTSGSDSVLKALQAATKGLTYTSESDKPVKAFLWKQEGGGGAVDEAALRAAGKVPNGAKVKTLKPAEFFEPMTTEQDWYGDAERAQAKRFQDLAATLQEQLKDVAAFRVETGDSTIDAYVVGRTADGDLAGISTQLVET